MTHRERASRLYHAVDWRNGDATIDAITAALKDVERKTRRPTLILCAEALALAGFAPAGRKVREWADIVDSWPTQTQPGAAPELTGDARPHVEVGPLPRGEVAEGPIVTVISRAAAPPSETPPSDGSLQRGLADARAGRVTKVPDSVFEDASETPPGKCADCNGTGRVEGPPSMWPCFTCSGDGGSPAPTGKP